jgi:hypothetical protein
MKKRLRKKLAKLKRIMDFYDAQIPLLKGLYEIELPPPRPQGERSKPWGPAPIQSKL